ncbi:DUF2199 domain-containing protein [Paenibacillus agaridevorans]
MPCYPDTLNLKARVHLRADGLRPYIEMEPTDHRWRLNKEMEILSNVFNK